MKIFKKPESEPTILALVIWVIIFALIIFLGIKSQAQPQKWSEVIWVLESKK